MPQTPATIRDEMLAAARCGGEALGQAATGLAAYLRSQQRDGVFVDRAGRADLYYTIFGLEALLALDESVDAAGLAAWLSEIDPAGLDLVHACGLARIWADLPGQNIPAQTRHELLEIIARHRSDDGGYASLPDCPHAGVYGSFLALSALQDLNAVEAVSPNLPQAIDALRRATGGFAGSPNGPATTPTTAAALTLLHQLRRPAHRTDIDWLLTRCDPDGGFHAAEGLHESDLLSTAVACFALQRVSQPLANEPVAAARRFVLNCQQDGGGFSAQPTIKTADCEYAFYALLALGCLEAMT